MAIPRGNQRQFNNQVAEQSNAADISSMITKTALQLSEQLTDSRKLSQKTELTNNLSQANSELFRVNEELKQEFIDSPSSEDHKKRQKDEFDNILKPIEESLSPFAKQEFQVKKQNLLAKYELSNIDWAIKQERANTKSQALQAIESDIKMAAALGVNGDVDGLVGLMEVNGSSLLESLTEVFGQAEAFKITKTYTADAAKSFMNSNIKSNPQQALELLEDERVQAVIDDVAVVQDLKEAATTQLDRQRKQQFTLELYDKIREGGEVWQKAIDGKLSFIEMQEFFANNSDRLTHKEKNFIAQTAGYTSGFKFDEKGNFVRTGKEKKEPEKRKTLTSAEKQANFAGLLMEGGGLLSGESFTNLPDDLVEKGGAVGAAMSEVGKFQAKVNQAFVDGQITKTQWEEISNNYIPTVGDFLAENLEGLETGEGWWDTGDMLGYGQVKKAADEISGSKKGEIDAGLLYANYYKELIDAAQKEEKDSIYKLNTLSYSDREDVYKNAYEEALKRTKQTSTNPFLWFEKDFPGYSFAIRSNLSQSSAEEAMNNASGKIYGEDNPPDIPKIIEEEVQNQVMKENKVLSIIEEWAF